MLQDFRHSLRLLRRSPGFAAVAIVVLALGIGANVGVFSVVNTLVLQPRPGRIDSLVGVFNRDRSRPDDYRNFSYPAYVDLRERSGVFESVLAQSFTTLGVRDGDLTRQAFGAVVSSNYFTTMGVTLAAGRAFTADEERPDARAFVAIASYTVWQRTGFHPSFLGSTVRINGNDFTIVGVAPKGFGGVMAFLSPQWWLPLGAYEPIVNDLFKERSTGLGDRQNYALTVAGALKAGLTRAAAQHALDAVAKQLADEYPASDHDRAFVLAGLQRTGVSSRPQSDGPLVALGGLLMLMSALVLTIACLNLANLLLARGAARRKEIAIRQALGSGRRRIVQQLLVEALVLSAVGAAVGLIAGSWTTSALTAWLASLVTFGIDFIVAPSARMVAAAAGFAILSTALFALGPAWSLSRPSMAADLKGEPGRVARPFVGTLLVVGQIAASLALVAAGGLFMRGAINAAAIDAGYPMAQQLVIGLDPSLAGYNQARTRATYRRVLDRIRSTPSVESASFASTVPFGDIMLSGRARTPSADKEFDARFDVIGSGYFETLGLRVLRGREFVLAEEHDGAAPVAIVDVTLAKQLFGDEDPIGRQLRWRVRQAETPQTYTIVGVVPSLRHDLFEAMPRAHVYIPYGSRFTTEMYVHVRAAAGMSDTALLASIVRELRRLDAQLPILSAKTMTMHRDTSISTWAVRAAASLFSAFGVLALLLAAIGVYGLKAYDVSRRTREIGIRMALGATAGDVQRLMLSEGGRTTLVGLVIGTLLAAGVGRLASGFLFRVSAIDPLVLAVSALVLTGAAMIACYLPARRATLVDPLEALRGE